jgi:hypothetical protein
VNSGFWSVIEINIGVICICLPPLRALLSRYLHFLKDSRSGIDGASDRPYPLGYVKTDPTSSKTSKMTSNSREVHNVGRGYPEESEEELVFMGNKREHRNGNGDLERNNSGIMKTTQFSVTEGTIGPEYLEKPPRLKHWKRDMRP